MLLVEDAQMLLISGRVGNTEGRKGGNRRDVEVISCEIGLVFIVVSVRIVNEEVNIEGLWHCSV